MKRLKTIFILVEQFLLKTSIVLAIVLIMAQVLLQFPSIRALITTVDALEGYPYTR
jgi:hypothetical protein